MILKFQSRIKDGKEHQLSLACQAQRPPRSSSCGKLLDYGEKIAFVVQTF
jgi:hypothetical protein